jgi:predicted DNA-binding protein with PD1-like motif
MRFLRQPGPVHPVRIDVFRGDLREARFSLVAGATLNEALTGPMVALGFQSGTVRLRDVAVSPFRYVMPGPADDGLHVAYFSAPREPLGVTRIEQANATFGWADGKPFIHCHAVWIEPDGNRRGGHILPLETVVAEPGDALGWGCGNIRIAAEPDPETNFTLFQPRGISGGGGVIVRVKPNEDIIGALETIAREQHIRHAVVRGSLGSLIGARFSDGGQVDDHATEVLVRQGYIRDGRAVMEMLVVDMQGKVHEGWLQRGENPVCITFDLMLDDIMVTT